MEDGAGSIIQDETHLIYLECHYLNFWTKSVNKYHCTRDHTLLIHALHLSHRKRIRECCAYITFQCPLRIYWRVSFPELFHENALDFSEKKSRNKYRGNGSGGIATSSCQMKAGCVVRAVSCEK